MKVKITRSEIADFRLRACEAKSVFKSSRKDFMYNCPYCGKKHMTTKNREGLPRNIFMKGSYRRMARIHALIKHGGGKARLRTYKGQHAIETTY